jgi:peptidyl-prolyl cis-trans isomerase C
MSRAAGTACCLLAATLLGCGAAWAQGAAEPPADPVVAKVDGQPIHLSDLKDAVQALPENVRGMPTQTLFPMLLEQLIDGRALVAEAHKSGLDHDPTVQRQVTAAEDRALQTAMLNKAVGPSVNDEAVRARYDQEIAGKPGAEEACQAHPGGDRGRGQKIIGQLKGGGDFAALAKQYSKDRAGRSRVAIWGSSRRTRWCRSSPPLRALQPGQVSPAPVHSQFGWHVILLVERRQAVAPDFEQARDELRQKMIQEGVQKAVAQARAAASVEKFNLDGSQVRATDTAEPPPAAPKP